MNTKIQSNPIQSRISAAKKLIDLNIKDIDKQLTSSYIYSFISGFFGVGIIVFNILFALWLYLINKMEFLAHHENPHIDEEIVIVMTFAFMLITSFFAIFLLRHQKKLSNDIKYFLNKKQQIQLFSSVLGASYFLAKQPNDDDETISFIQNTFTETSKQIFSNFAENNLGNHDDDNPILTKMLDTMTNNSVDKSNSST